MTKEYIKNNLLRKDGRLDGNKTKKLRETNEALYCIYFDVKNPVCECGNRLKLKSWSKGFRLFCSPECQKSSKKTIEKSRKTRQETGNTSKTMKVVWSNRSKEDIAKIVKNIENTNIDRYGAPCILSLKAFRDKIRETNIQKYGVPCTLQNKEIQDKIKKTNIEKYGVPCVLQNKEIIRKNSISTRETNIKNGKWVADEELSDWGLYKRIVRKITEQNYRKYKEFINPNNIKRVLGTKEGAHLDHKFSILECFRHNVPSYIAGGVNNLSIINSKENIRKSSKCSITLEYLLSKSFI